MKNNDLFLHKLNMFIVPWGIFIHIILLWGVMDVNFHSPIIPGLSVIPMPKDSPAKRVFIFVADGLRYRTFKNNIPPYLSSIIQNHGVSGISHTRMPTESRPGNIAIVAGLYEDPSALFTGWKKNPIDFDSIFNKSRASWLWGSPDIINLFIKANHKNIYGANYPASWQDFSNNASAMKRLDLWVFDQYFTWLKDEAFIYKTKNKIILYFHLLGCDTIGHARKPLSQEYVETIREIDYNIQEVVKKTEKFFNDNSTVYIFTSDHGMTDWGSHGSGSTDETETPFIIWGAGIIKDTHLYHIEQIDITPLISTLLGIPIPINNEGVLPYKLLDLKYKEFILNAFLTNAKQLGEQVKANRELTIGKNTANIYWKDKMLKSKLLNAEKLLNLKTINDSTNEIEHIFELAKDTLKFYRRYQTKRSTMCLLFMWIGWITFLFTNLCGIQRQTIQLKYFSWSILANFTLIVIIILFIIEYTAAGCKEWKLLGYGIISILSLWLACQEIIKKKPTLKINSKKSLLECVGVFILNYMMLYGLKYRWIFSIGMLLTLKLMKLIFDESATSKFIFTGVAIAAFPLLPVVGSQPRIYLIIITLIMSVLLILCKQKIYQYNKAIEFIRILLTVLMCLDLIDGRSWISWLILLSTPIVIWLYPNNWNQRIFGISMAFLSPFSLLSTSYESLFFFIFSIHLQCWPTYEYLQKSMFDKKDLNLRKFSMATFFMLYMLICFFGTGNIASISSFDPSWTRHFVTLFSPFTMTTLIIVKLILPLILLGCYIQILAPNSKMFSAVLLLSDCLAIPLMFGVTTEGSWLDIGSAISRFIIVILLPCLLLLFYYLTKPLTVFSLQKFIQKRKLKMHRLKI